MRKSCEGSPSLLPPHPPSLPSLSPSFPLHPPPFPLTHPPFPPSLPPSPPLSPSPTLPLPLPHQDYAEELRGFKIGLVVPHIRSGRCWRDMKSDLESIGFVFPLPADPAANPPATGRVTHPHQQDNTTQQYTLSIQHNALLTPSDTPANPPATGRVTHPLNTTQRPINTL